MHRYSILLAAACLAAAPFASSSLADSAPFGSLSGVVSTGALGNLSAYTGNNQFISSFNTDNGQIRSSASGGILVATLPFTTVTQYSGGPTLNVFNFANFDSNSAVNFSIVGSKPAVIAATGNITILGHIHVTTGSGLGGLSGNANLPSSYSGDAGGNPGGGAGGTGAGNLFSPSIYGGYSGGTAGGGGSVSPGQAGSHGSMQTGAGGPTLGFENPGASGGTAQDTSIFQGGGGGGGGTAGNFPGERDPGVNGGAGGGALFFITPNNFTLTSTGSLDADGSAGLVANVVGGSSGGGGGGELWFDVGKTFDNEGLIAALGASGGNPHNSGVQAGLNVGGSGAGGELLIDPTEIINNGTLNVSDGLGGATYGGSVQLLAATTMNNGSIIGQVPEPTATLLAVCGAGMLLIRRRIDRRVAR